MKTRLKNWITTSAGIILITFSIVTLIQGHYESNVDYPFSLTIMGLGLLLLFSKDTLIKFFANKFKS